MAWGAAGIGARPTLPAAAARPRPHHPVPPVDAARVRACGLASGGRPAGRRRRSFGPPAATHGSSGGYAAAAPLAGGAGAPVGRTPSRIPHRGASRVRAGAAVVARRRRRARADAPPTAGQSLRGGAAGAGAGRHVDAGNARLTARATWVGTIEDGLGGESTPAAVAPLVRRPTNVVTAAEKASG